MNLSPHTAPKMARAPRYLSSQGRLAGFFAITVPPNRTTPERMRAIRRICACMERASST
jgi:hypothetical protein